MTFGTLLSSQGTDASFVLTLSGFPPGASLRCFTLYQELFRSLTAPFSVNTRAYGHTAADPRKDHYLMGCCPNLTGSCLRASVVGRDLTVHALSTRGKSITHRTRRGPLHSCGTVSSYDLGFRPVRRPGQVVTARDESPLGGFP
ncbi:hypothetical protein B7P34_27280 [Streptosporangium nondiastaticum]|uniref:Uncharacterized protein n=1 Tax=Streptosporangium nondiastaticum TaxID=35764 RepID=A0A9X7JL05_9ACTN|nr:hypothetical protein B7P34_27280 [Streptosporangium nondiastaticum]